MKLLRPDGVNVSGVGLTLGLVATALAFGFRHGIDWDHIAALTDITSSQEQPRTSMVLATLYATGHALVVLVLGLAAIVLSAELPSSVDDVMQYVVGVTLILLGVYVFYSLIRHGRDFRMRSRWMLVLSLIRRVVRRFRGERVAPVVIEHDHEHPAVEAHDHQHAPVRDVVGSGARAGESARRHRHGHRHVGSLPTDPFLEYSRATAFGVGMIHGIGAETPTQVLIFVAAAGAGGRVAGVIVLLCFLVGLLASNTAISAAATLGFVNAAENWKIYVGVSVVTGGFSLAIGTIFLAGGASRLPALFGG
jgi:cytochrome c biogenesis protein CcdA